MSRFYDTLQHNVRDCNQSNITTERKYMNNDKYFLLSLLMTKNNICMLNEINIDQIYSNYHHLPDLNIW